MELIDLLAQLASITKTNLSVLLLSFLSFTRTLKGF